MSEKNVQTKIKYQKYVRKNRVTEKCETKNKIYPTEIRRTKIKPDTITSVAAAEAPVLFLFCFWNGGHVVRGV